MSWHWHAHTAMHILHTKPCPAAEAGPGPALVSPGQLLVVQGSVRSFVCDLFASQPASSAAPGHQDKSINRAAKGTALRLQSCRWEGVSADSAAFVISSAWLTSTAVSSECILLVEVNGGWDSRNQDPL